MRLVAVSVVKNEADIIEAFVRHTRAWVDHHLVFDHDSTDGTREILQALSAEGVPLTLYTDDALGNLQQARSNRLTRLAAADHRADWVVPLDADEILCGPDRGALESALADVPRGQAASLPLVDYLPTTADPASDPNPVTRLAYCTKSASRTIKVVVPADLAVDDAVTAGKGSHTLVRGSVPLPAPTLPAPFQLAHLALRSPQHQALRVVLAELQKLSRGRAHAGLDVHYRLGFQLLAQYPELFFSSLRLDPTALRHAPILYRGAALRFTTADQGWTRVARALLPYLEKLASSHGQLLDASGAGATSADSPVQLRVIPPDSLPAEVTAAGGRAFDGFEPLEGWEPQEGPVPAAFLPPFHWGLAPATRLGFTATTAGPVRLLAELLTYSEGQSVRIELNGAPVHQLAFPRTNQLERLQLLLPARTGRNELAFHYTQALVTTHDPRRLAALFLRLQLSPAS
jgi:hypothetical protein